MMAHCRILSPYCCWFLITNATVPNMPSSADAVDIGIALSLIISQHVGCAQAPPLQLCANRPLSLATFPNEQGLIISTQKLQGRFRKTPEFASLTSG
mmetsp:Transcript_1286/g.4157  ORF Transcript_1286/g.4157 Transcript_1286/m.4157 type:complete len:97 (-) Transcript_1286:1974-2264(-)